MRLIRLLIALWALRVSHALDSSVVGALLPAAPPDPTPAESPLTEADLDAFLRDAEALGLSCDAAAVEEATAPASAALVEDDPDDDSYATLPQVLATPDTIRQVWCWNMIAVPWRLHTARPLQGRA